MRDETPPLVRLDGKVIVITGAGRGIGAATARLAAALGARVLVNDLDAAEAASVAEAICTEGGTAISHVCDIADWEASRAMIDRAVAEWGRIDGLFNNAGLFRLSGLLDQPEADLRAMLAVNVVGSFACAYHAARVMSDRGAGGAILNVTSGAQMGLLGMGGYGATKGAMASATFTWAEELRASRIRVNALSPMAATRMMDETQRFLGRQIPGQLRPEVNAPVACYLLSEAAALVTGQVVRIEGRLLSLVSHPGIANPVLTGDWDVDAVARAFHKELAHRQFPSGTVGMQIAIQSNASIAWSEEEHAPRGNKRPHD